MPDTELSKAAKRGRPKGAYSGTWVVMAQLVGGEPMRFYRADLFEQRMRYWTKHGIVVSKVIWRVHPTKVVGSGRAGNTQTAVDQIKAHMDAQEAKGHPVHVSNLEDAAAAAQAITAAADQLAPTQPGRAATMREVAEPHLEVVEAAARPGQAVTALVVARQHQRENARRDRLRSDAVRHNEVIAARVEGEVGEGRAEAPAGPSGVLAPNFDQIRAQILEANFAKLTKESKGALDTLIDRLEGKSPDAPGTYSQLYGEALDPEFIKRPMSALLTMGAVGSRIGARITPPTMHHADGTPFQWKPIWYGTREWGGGNINWFSTKQERQLLSEYEGFIVQKAYEHVRAYFPTGVSTISDEERLAIKHDAQQQGRMILLDLARIYDPTKKVPFIEWATATLDKRLQDFVFEEKKQHMLQHGQYTQDQIDTLVDPEMEYAKEVMGRQPQPEEHALFKEAVDHTMSVFGASEHTMSIVRALILNGNYGPAVFRVAGGTRDEIAEAYHKSNAKLHAAQAAFAEAQAEAAARKEAVRATHPAKQRLLQAQAEYLTEYARARLVQDVAKYVTERNFSKIYPRIEKYVDEHHLTSKETFAFLAFMNLQGDHPSTKPMTTTVGRQAPKIGGNPIELPTAMERVGGHITRQRRYLMAANSEVEVARMAAAAGLGTENEWRTLGPSLLRTAFAKLSRLPASQQQELRTVLSTMARRASGQLAEIYSVNLPTTTGAAPAGLVTQRASTLAQRHTLAINAKKKSEESLSKVRNQITAKKNSLTPSHKIIHEAQSKLIHAELEKQKLSFDAVDWHDDSPRGSAARYQTAYASAASRAAAAVRRNPKGRLKIALKKVASTKADIAALEAKRTKIENRISRLSRYAHIVEARRAVAREGAEGARTKEQMFGAGDVKNVESEIDKILGMWDADPKNQGVRQVFRHSPENQRRLDQLRGIAAAKRAELVTERPASRFTYVIPKDAVRAAAAKLAATAAAAKPKKKSKKKAKKSISPVGDEMLAKSVLDFADDAMDKQTTYLAAEVFRTMLDLRVALEES